MLAAASVWLQPPPVLPLPSRTGPDGPPRPAIGLEPAPGSASAPTNPLLVRAQDRLLRSGPFPTGGLARGISDGALFESNDAEVRSLALADTRATGAAVVRIPINWASLVKVSARAVAARAPSSDADGPPGFDPTDPASAMYEFTQLDAALRSAVSAGLTPLLVVTHAPAFAEAPGRWRYAYPGSWSPDPTALQAFAVALARRYSGSFADPLDAQRTLPRVRLYQAWNEPNLPRYLEPQWIAREGRWSAYSPLIYRQLLNAFYAGIKSVDSHDLVVSAGVAPNGDPAGVGRMAPVTFLRTLLCLQARRTCAQPPHFDVLSFHPLSVGDPDRPAAASLDVSIADAAKVTGLLRTAERRHTALPVGRKAVWVTELNWESAPAASHGVPPGLQARWVSRALHRLWAAGVGLVDWQFLVDPYPALTLGEAIGGGTFQVPRPAGLYTSAPAGALAGAVAKPFLRGFTLPFDPLRVDRGHVRAWALLGGPDVHVSLQRRGQRGAWQTLARLHADSHGVLNVLVKLRGSALLRVRKGQLSSAPIRVSATRTPRVGPRPSAGDSLATQREASVSGSSCAAAAGMWLIACSASAVIVRLGLTPTLAGIAEPSQTSRFS